MDTVGRRKRKRVTDQLWKGMEIYPTEQGHLINVGWGIPILETRYCMKIENSSISMASTHSLSQMTSAQSVTVTRIPNEKENSLGFFQNYLKQPLQQSKGVASTNRAASIMSIKLQLIHKIFDAICGRNNLQNSNLSPSTISAMGIGTVWEKTTATYVMYSEEEATSFASKGMVRTADGRNIEFDVELSMSRSFTASYSQIETYDYMITDPLVINLDTDITSVSDMKFFFDLDCDGKEEEISFAGAGSGFLALDKNDDGVINDGSELFGTKSGNGFADLAKYDKDHNGWIDENDEFFDRLKVWTRNENGEDCLIDLRQAGVGAIFLGAVSTDFSLTDDSNYANAFIRSTGIYLKENGGAGTISQVDLTS